MNKSYLIILAVAVVLIAAFGFVITAGEPPAATVVSGTATSTASTTVTASKASAVSPSESTRASRPSGPSGESVAVTGRACSANDLTGSASWARSGSTVTGVLTIKNSSRSACVLSRASDLQILSGTKILDVAMGSRPGDSVLIQEGKTLGVWFSWENWCAAEPTLQAKVKLILPGGGGYLEVPIIDPSGRPSTGAPLCGARGYPSTVSIWW